jgi:serine phosphatase RsbU (regulator of sigma subunit)
MNKAKSSISQLTPEEIEIQQQRNRIAESLQYARVIQKAVLPKEEQVKKVFPNHFVLLLPKDILSGDFYWIHKNGNQICFAVADCTGHGVPGAMMSVMGISFLNELVVRSCDFKANRLLNQLREKVMKALGQTGAGDVSEDGMDIAMCIIDDEDDTLQYSGAYNPLYIVRKGELIIFSPDHMPVGVHIMEEKSFTNHEIKLEEGDIIYLFSDGYPDQVGGPQNKKFMYNNFRNLLLDIYNYPMDKQVDILKSTLAKWMGSRKQIDDILVMGVKYSRTNNV